MILEFLLTGLVKLAIFMWPYAKTYIISHFILEKAFKWGVPAAKIGYRRLIHIRNTLRELEELKKRP